MVYNVEPFRAAIRQGDWKLIWRTPLPSALELYNLADDVSEKTDVAAQHPDTVVALQKRVQVLAKEMAKPMFLVEALSTIKSRPSAPPALPNEEAYFDEEP